MRLLRHLQANPRDTIGEAATKLGLSKMTAQKYVQALKEEGLLEREVRWVVAKRVL